MWFTWSSAVPCKEQYADSTFKEDFKPGFRIHKSDVITGKDICGVAKHFLTKCTKLQQSNATKLKTLKFNWLNKCKWVIMTLEVSCGVQKSFGREKSKFFLYFME